MFDSPVVSAAPLIVYVDIKSPYAFVAIKPTLELERALGVSFDWRPLTLDIPSYLGSAKKRAGKVVESNRSASQWLGVKYAYKDARRYAQRQGYVLKGTEKIWDSSIVNIALLWVIERDRSHVAQFFEAVYPAFWRRELDIEDVSVVSACIDACGVSSEGFAAFQQAGDNPDTQLGPGRATHDALQSQLHAHGIYGVPTYVFDDTILFGREHLPYVRWSLSGRQGPAPDVAYVL